MINSSSKGGLPFHIMTVFIPRENIFILEEWLAWHTYMGVDKFYLYDNTGSTHLFAGHAIATDGKNLRGEDIHGMTAHLSDDDIELLTKEIISKYNVEIVRWAPVENGRIMYKQHIAYKHYVESLKENTWTAFIDMDEFIVGDIELSLDIPRYFMKSVAFRRWSPFMRVKDIVDFANPETILGEPHKDSWIHPLPKSIIQTSHYVYSLDIHCVAIPNGEPTVCKYHFNHYSVGPFVYDCYVNRLKHNGVENYPKDMDSMLNEQCNILNKLAEKHIKYENFTQI